MAITWNKIIPRWGGDTIEPPEAKKDTGYIAGDKPPAKWENWLRKGTYEALDETRDVIEGIDTQLAQITTDVSNHLQQVFSQSLFVVRDASITGQQIVSGFVKKPKYLTIRCVIVGTKKQCHGIVAENSQRVTSTYQNETTNWITGKAIHIGDSDSVFTNGDITINNDNTITINWTKNGSPTGVIIVQIDALYH